MKLNKSQIAKIDPLLEEALMHAGGDEVIRVIMSLGEEKQLQQNTNNQSLEPKDFPSSTAYRQALIDRRKNLLTEVLGDTIQALQNLSLKTIGGTMSRVVVVEGSADAILRSLELPGVSHVSLDQLIALPEIAPSVSVEDFANLYIKTLDILINKKTERLIFQAFEQYIINYHNRHNKLKILGMQQPVALDDIYTNVQCVLPDDMWYSDSIEELHKLHRQAGNRSFQNRDTEKKDGIAVANEQQYLMILGAPGAGKSTFLRKIGLEALKGKSGQIQRECIPVFIELKKFTGNEFNLLEAIQQEFLQCQLPFVEEFVTQALQQGKLLILLDGLDEIPTRNIDLAINRIQDFVNFFYQNYFIISCRTSAYRNKFNDFSEFAITDFDDDQIQQFIQNWFHSDADKQAKTGDKCWDLLQKVENEAAKELAHTPLLLTFLCLVYDRSQNLPDNRSVLYRKALRILLEEWASEKRILQYEIYQGMNTELEELLLSEIAYIGFESNRLFFSQRDIVGQIKTFLVHNLNAPQHLDGEAVLDAIVIQQGILVERARDVFSFSHLTLQEYLTAQYIDDHRQVEKLVTQHLTDNRWKEVFLLVAGLMRGGADELLLLMEKEAQKYINTPKLEALLNWAEQVTVGSQGNYKPVGKRASAIARSYSNAIAIANAIAMTYSNAITYSNTIAIAKTIAIAIANAIPDAIANVNAIANANAIAKIIAIANLEAIAITIKHSDELKKSAIFNNKVNFTVLIARLEALKAKIPDDKQPKEVRLAFAKHLQKTLLDAFHLTPEMIDLSEEEAQALEKYLYANHLIIQCKQAAVRVSPTTWEAIEARMLLVPGS